jgi:hypothetical protein
MVAQRLGVIGIEAQHALERVHGIAFARQIDENLPERNERRKVIDVASDESDYSRQSAAGASGSPIRADQLDYSGIVVRRRDEHCLQLSDGAAIVTRTREEPTERYPCLYLPLVDDEAGSIRRYRRVRISKGGVKVAYPLHNVGVARLVRLQRDEDLPGTGVVERGNARFGRQQKEIHVGAAGFD